MKYAITLNNQTIATADNFEAAYTVATDMAVIAFGFNYVSENLDVELGTALWIGTTADNKGIQMVVIDNSDYIEKTNKGFAQLGCPEMAEIAKEVETMFQQITKQPEQAKSEENESKFKNFPHIKIGSIFASSWGFEQTNVDFYQVIKRTEKTVTVQKIASKSAENQPNGVSAMSEYVMPDLDNFKAEKPITKKMKSWKKDGSEVNIKISSYSTAYETDPEQKHYTSWYY